MMATNAESQSPITSNTSAEQDPSSYQEGKLFVFLTTFSSVASLTMFFSAAFLTTFSSAVYTAAFSPSVINRIPCYCSFIILPSYCLLGSFCGNYVAF